MIQFDYIIFFKWVETTNQILIIISHYMPLYAWTNQDSMKCYWWLLITAPHGRQAEVAVTPEAETSKKDHFWMSVKRIIQQFCLKEVWGDEVFIDIDSHKWSYDWVTGIVLYNPGCRHYTTPLKTGRVTNGVNNMWLSQKRLLNCESCMAGPYQGSTWWKHLKKKASSIWIFHCFLCQFSESPRKTNVEPQKWVVCSCFSFSNGIFMYFQVPC